MLTAAKATIPTGIRDFNQSTPAGSWMPLPGEAVRRKIDMPASTQRIPPHSRRPARRCRRHIPSGMANASSVTTIGWTRATGP